jgi:hypothetical protein
VVGGDWGRHSTQCGSRSYRLHDLTLEMSQGGGVCLTRAIQLPDYVIPSHFAHFEILPVGVVLGSCAEFLASCIEKVKDPFPSAYAHSSSATGVL